MPISFEPQIIEAKRCNPFIFGAISSTDDKKNAFAVFLVIKTKRTSFAYVIWTSKKAFDIQDLFIKVRTLLITKYKITLFLFAIRQETSFEKGLESTFITFPEF